MNNSRKWLSLLLALTMLFTCIPVGMMAEEDGADAVVVEEVPVVIETAPSEEPAAGQEPAPVVESIPAEEPAPVVERTPAEEPALVEEAAPAEETPVEEAQVEEPAPVEEPVTEQETAPVEEPAPVEAPAEETPAVEETEPAIEEITTPADEQEVDPVEEVPAVEESMAEEPVTEEPASDELVEEEPAVVTFSAGLAYLSEGDVYTDVYLKNVAGQINKKAVVYAVERAKGDGELTDDDIIKVVANIAGVETNFFVKNSRLEYLVDSQIADYKQADHEDAIGYQGIKLDPVDFTATVVETEAEPVADELVEANDEAEPVAVKQADTVEDEDNDIAEDNSEEVAEDDSSVAIPVETVSVQSASNQSLLEMLSGLGTENGETTAVDEAESNDEVVVEAADSAVIEIKFEKTVEVEAANASSSSITIKQQPVDIKATEGEYITFSVEAEGEGLTYQWQYSQNEGEKWYNGASKTNEYKWQLTAARNNRLVRVIVTDANGNTVTSDAARGTIKVGPEIITQPADIEALEGEYIVFSVEAEGDGLTYQWQYSQNEGTNWSNGASKTNEYKWQLTAARNNRLVRVIITDAEGNTVTSEPARGVINNVFDDGDFTYELIDGTLILVSYNGSAATVTVPEKVKNYTVTKIGAAAFENNTVLAIVDLPDTITIIGKRAFAGCTSLKEMK